MLEEYTAWEAKQGKVRARVIMYGERDAAVRLPLNERAIAAPSRSPPPHLMCTQAVPVHLTKAYAKAQEAVSLRRTYETAVAPDRPADAHLLAAYMAYIRLEQVGGGGV